MAYSSLISICPCQRGDSILHKQMLWLRFGKAHLALTLRVGLVFDSEVGRLVGWQSIVCLAVVRVDVRGTQQAVNSYIRCNLPLSVSRFYS